VFLNLLINAWQSIPDASSLESNEIRVSIGTDPNGDAFATIADTGSGIPKEIQGRVFDAFFTTKPVGIGSGLGLSISRNIVESFGGRISFDSVVGRGTTFRVWLPAAASSPSETKQSARADRPLQEEQRLRILVVDDEPLVAVTVGRLLARKADLVAVSSARQALSLLAQGERFDRILCDVMMPEMSGPELHAKVARFSVQAAGRLVFMTGGTFSEGTQSFLDSWKHPVLKKPFDGDSLWNALKTPVS
jgi:CheY-like chemotaxis protein